MVRYSGACKRNKDYSVNCEGDCTSCKVVNAETGKFDIYGFMEQATPLKLEDTEYEEARGKEDRGSEDRGSEQTTRSYSYVTIISFN